MSYTKLWDHLLQLSSSRWLPYSLISMFSISSGYEEGVSLGVSTVFAVVQFHLTRQRVREKQEKKISGFLPSTFGTTKLPFPISLREVAFKCCPHCHHCSVNLWPKPLSGTDLLGEKQNEKKKGDALSTLWLLEACFPGSLARKAGFLLSFLCPLLLQISSLDQSQETTEEK